MGDTASTTRPFPLKGCNSLNLSMHASQGLSAKYILRSYGVVSFEGWNILTLL